MYLSSIFNFEMDEDELNEILHGASLDWVKTDELRGIIRMGFFSRDGEEISVRVISKYGEPYLAIEDEKQNEKTGGRLAESHRR